MSTNRVLQEGRWAQEVETLGSLLRSELSACEAYRTAVHRLERDGERPALSLRYLYRSHRRHADGLREMIRRLGGHPPDSLGTWGVWASVHERVAGLADDAETLRALREGERHSVELARGALHDLDGPAASFVAEEVLPELVADLDLLALLDEGA